MDIVKDVLNNLNLPNKINEPNEDWMAYFFDKVKLVSEESLQEVWSNLLAGELERPGKTKKRLIDLIASMDQKDCEGFESLANFIFYENNSIPRLLIMNFSENSFYKEYGLNHNLLLNLQSLGLISYDIVTQTTLTYPNSNGRVNFSTLDNSFFVSFIRTKNIFMFDGLELTPLGMELSKLIKFKSRKEHFKNNMKLHNKVIELT